MSRRASAPIQRWLKQYPADEKAAALLERLAERLDDETARSTALAADMLKALNPLSPDATTVAAVLVIGRRSAGDEVDANLPDSVARLVEQFGRVVRFDRRYLPDSAERAENLRRLILAMIADVRVALLVLAWQLARMHLARDDETRRALARETQAIHGPLANRLGVWQLKWQLEDLAFRYLEPDQYARIERQVAEQRADRERAIRDFMDDLSAALDEAGITHEISGRAKHTYSIWRKMQRKGLDVHELFDVRAVRVLVDDVGNCYAALGLVHSRWRPVPGEFDDYISQPKPNLYRSLHTAVQGPSGRVFEVQIRTHEMHAHAELGVAAHWRYKEGGPSDAALEQRVGVMRQLIEQADAGDDATLVENFETLTSEDRVYVLTPNGDVVDLVQGSTALDFAYHVHTEVGHRCRGAKVNGRIVPLTHELANGDRVEILTGKQPSPSRDWLNPQLGYLKSGRARGKVRQYFRALQFDENLAAGRAAVEAEMKRLDVDDTHLPEVARQYNLRSVDDLMASVGAGNLTATQVVHALLRRRPARDDDAGIPVRAVDDRGAPDDAVRIEGVGNLVHQLARCCSPVPGDAIAGFITRSRGVSIHRADCAQYLRLASRHPERRIRVDWKRSGAARYPVRVRIEAWDRRDLIRDVGAVLSSHGLGARAMSAGRGTETDAVFIDLELEVPDLDQLSTLLGRLQSLPNVTSVQRRR
ncbi:MAG: bifunctional (p)ppGpp synthetase/guanosine-3',5'-bis(diphosphate) 3'-pyrophosphohydrolase [Wenzhouxiangellaceae bacterium]|nr:bifunctional (p)ppGpp synthetase/guanosine-3',5'-bis(diphosphate) 3'-pyrophosphohydrolase [Wenzhouxiangellaceae bacterium]